MGLTFEIKTYLVVGESGFANNELMKEYKTYGEEAVV